MTDERDELDRRIAELEGRLDAVPSGPAAASLADELGQLLLVRFARHRTPAVDRDRAITLLEQALAGPVADPVRTRVALGMMLFLRAMPVELGPDTDGTALMAFVAGLMSGAFNDPVRLSDRRRATRYLRQIIADEAAEPQLRAHAQGMVGVLDLLDATDPTAQLQALMSLAAVAGDLGEQQRTLIDALRAVTVGPLEPEALTPVLELLPAGHRLQPVIAAQIGVLIAERGHVGDLPEHLAGMAPMLREAFDTLRDDDPLRDDTVRRLAGMLMSTAAFTAAPADVTRVVELADRLVAEAPRLDAVAAGKDRFLRGMALTLRGRLAGDPADLRVAAGDLTEALDAVPPDDPLGPVIAGTLGALLNDRRLLLGLHADAEAGQAFLDRARTSLARHAASTDRDVITLLGLMSRTTVAVLQRDAAGLDAVIPQLRTGLDAWPRDYPWRSRIDATLGLAYLTRGGVRSDLGDIRAGLALLGRAGDEVAVELSGRPALAAVGAVAELLEGLLADAGDATLAAAAARLDQAVDAGPMPRDDRIVLRTLQAQVALIRHDRHGAPGQLAAAIAGFERIAADLDAEVGTHPLAGHIHTQLADAHRQAGDERAAVGAGLAALRAYGDDVLLQSGAGHGLDAARHAAELARTIAGRCLDAGRERDVLDAVEALELGRGLVLHAATVAAGVPDLLRAAGHDDLAGEWERQPPPAVDPSRTGVEAVGQLAEGLIAVPSDLRHRALTALRAAPGGRLPATPPVEAIAAALSEVDADALVYLLPGDDSDGGRLLVVPAAGPVLQLPAPALIARAEPLTRFLTGGPRRELGAPPGFAPPGRGLDGLCAWAWPALIEPLLKHLGDTGPDRPHRLVLVPVGGLGYVPWHAARSPAGRYANEPFAFSYAASARQLTTVAARPAPPVTGAVTMLADPTGDLPGASREVEFLHRHCYPHATVLGRAPGAGGAGTPAEVIEAFQGDALLHLACHARTGATPDRSSLRLRGETLTVARILAAARRRPDAAPGGLVVLSACVSDLTGAAYDEALTLATAFLASGAGSVVGSRWAVDDATTACLMAVFHRLRTSGLRDRDALRAAQRWMLDPDRDVPADVAPLVAALAGPPGDRLGDPAVWAPFAHHGR